MNKVHKVNIWEAWVMICEEMGINPYKNVDIGVDMGGGESEDYEYVGDYPEKIKEEK